MTKKNFNKGVLLTSFGSFWWGFFGVIYFKYISFAGHIEVLIHRSVWTAFLLNELSVFFPTPLILSIVDNKYSKSLIKYIYMFIRNEFK